MTMKHWAIAGAVLWLAAPAAAADWPAARAQLITAAEKEGGLVVYIQPNKSARDFVQQEFAKAYPKIDVSLSVMNHPEFMARIQTERSAGKYLWDLAFTGATSGYVLSKRGVIDPLLPEILDPEAAKEEAWGGWNDAFVDVDHKHVFSVSAFTASGFYNADHIPPATAERMGLKIMLDPAYKGKSVWHDPSIPGAGASFAYLVRRSLGDDGVRKLVTGQSVNFVRNQHQVTEEMARGTAWIGLGPPVRKLIEPYTKAGVKADPRPFGNTPEVATLSIGGSALYVFNKRPHPSATRLFVNWLLTRETQEALAKALDQGSRRRDIPWTADPDQKPIVGAKYFAPQREENEPEAQAAVKLIQQIRQESK
jgi:ABC-type glycerol-3-phosphate transport system substrate-binding protein